MNFKMRTENTNENKKTLCSALCSHCSLCSLYLSIYKGLTYTNELICTPIYIRVKSYFSENKRTNKNKVGGGHHLYNLLNDQCTHFEKISITVDLNF